MRRLLKKLAATQPLTMVEGASLTAILLIGLWLITVVPGPVVEVDTLGRGHTPPIDVDAPIAPTPPPQSAVARAPEIILTDIHVTSRSNGKLAILRVNGGPRVAVSEGSNVEAGIKLLRISPTFVVLSINGRDVVIQRSSAAPSIPPVDDGSSLAIAEKTGVWPAESATNPVPDP